LKSCTMCGQYCVFLVLDKYTRGKPSIDPSELIQRFEVGVNVM